MRDTYTQVLIILLSFLVCLIYGVIFFVIYIIIRQDIPSPCLQVTVCMYLK